MNWRYSIYSVFRSFLGVNYFAVSWVTMLVRLACTLVLCLNLFTPLLICTDYMMMLENEKRSAGNGCPPMTWCSTYDNCNGGDAGGSYEKTPETCGPSSQLVCCTYFAM